MVNRNLVIAVLVVAAFVIMNPVVALAQGQKIDINTATAEQLQSLKHVGEKYAQAIVEYRTVHGPFKTPEEIMKVKGIGRKTYELNKDRIIVNRQENKSKSK